MTIAEHQIDVCIMGLHSLHRCKRRVQILKLVRLHLCWQSAYGSNVTNLECFLPGNKDYIQHISYQKF